MAFETDIMYVLNLKSLLLARVCYRKWGAKGKDENLGGQKGNKLRAMVLEGESQYWNPREFWQKHNLG